MLSLLDYIHQVSGVILLVCAVYYYRHFKKTKRERKLTTSELSMFVITKISFFLFGVSYYLLLLDKD